MNQENRTYFLAEFTEEGIHVEVNGTGGELVNLFANVIADNDDLAEVIKMAIFAVEMKEGKLSSKLEDLMSKLGLQPNDRDLAEVLSQNPPIAQA